MPLEALRIWWFAFILNAPFYFLGCVPFILQLRVKKRTLYLSIALCSGATGALYALHSILKPEFENFLSMSLFLSYIGCMLLYSRLFAVPTPQLFYVFFVVQAYAMVLSAMAKLVDVSLFPAHIPQLAAASYSLMVLLLVAVSYPFMYRLLRGRLRRNFEQLPEKGCWKICVAPALFFVINQLYTNLIYQRMFAGTPQLEVQTVLIFLLILVTCFVTYIVTLSAATDAAERARLEADVAGMERWLAMQAQSYAQLTESIERAREARHDLHHHLSVIAAYVEKEDREGIAQYLEDYRRGLPQNTETPLCENYAVDTVVRHYLAHVRDMGAELDVKLALPREVGIPDSDLCIVFGNLFENASNSVAAQNEGDRFIRARCSVRDGKLILTLDNSTNGPAGDARRDGKGLKSVTAVAQKYGGGVSFTQAGGVYHSSVMLCVPHG